MNDSYKRFHIYLVAAFVLLVGLVVIGNVAASRDCCADPYLQVKQFDAPLSNGTTVTCIAVILNDEEFPEVQGISCDW